MSITGLTDDQVTAIAITERVNSVISILGILFVLFTYMFSSHFDKPINRLIFFASWGNLGSNIAALISDAGPLAGGESPLCQFQAFLVQMYFALCDHSTTKHVAYNSFRFLGVDALWAFCMAINVYLAFFHGFSIMQFRSLDRKYLLLCYGLSFIPALVFCFIRTRQRGKLYGPATIWCWIDTEWDVMRILFLYLWVWLAIVFALAVYVRAGVVIYRRRKELHGFLNPLNEFPFKAVVTTEVHVTSEPSAGNPTKDPESAVFAQDDGTIAYETKVNANQADKVRRASSVGLPAVLRIRSLTREVAKDAVTPEAWLYARVAFLFYISLMITWVPSSINRVYALIHPDSVNFGMNYAASFVFPLQGLWNVIVYVITSQTACSRFWRDLTTHTSGNSASNPYMHRTGQRGKLSGVLGSLSSSRQRLDSAVSDDTVTLTDTNRSELAKVHFGK